MTERTRHVAIGGAFAVAIILTIVVLWQAFAGGPTPDNSRNSDSGTVTDSVEPAPEFDIPKIADCAPAQSDEVTKVQAQLQPHTGVATSARSIDGHDVYVAAIITYEDQPTSREPGLWVIRDGKIYAVGDTTAYSAAPPATDIGVFGDRAAASTAIGCAAGY
ncbi:hypothetical protein [Gordonia sihwensis]|uniref:hypothetical protein n=1 Tax=Gordonia sihwensis TaxID=173559 RepID=UPI0005EDAC91|nr:hypothetical protein [Gordonia sihwensis]KJR10451.1 hypothetical protein UG54_00160 [Gordonia sihwensis]